MDKWYFHVISEATVTESRVEIAWVHGDPDTRFLTTWWGFAELAAE